MNRIAFTFFGRQMNNGFGQGVPRVRGFSAEGETVPSLVERSAQSGEAFGIKVFASGFSHCRLPLQATHYWIESAKPSVW